MDWMRGCTITGDTMQGGPYPDDRPATITMRFGPRAPIEVRPGVWTGWIDPTTGQRVDNHQGFDADGDSPTDPVPLVALGYGVCTRSLIATGGDDDAFGNAVECSYKGDDGNTYRALYAHMRDAPLVNEGDAVIPGQALGVQGETGSARGSHLHCAMWVNDYSVDPLSVLVQANPVGFAPPLSLAPLIPLPALTRAQLGAALVDEANVHGILITRDEAVIANAETYRVNIMRDPATGAPL